MTLPTDRDERNALPVWDGCIAYFPDAWAEIAKVSVLGNKQHALGAKLRFARDVSTDHENKIVRHLLDHAAGHTFDTDGTYHLAKAAWRALAALQVAIEHQQLLIDTDRYPEAEAATDAMLSDEEIINRIRNTPITLMHADVDWPADNGASDVMDVQGYAFDAAMIGQKKTAPTEEAVKSGPRHYYPTPDLSPSLPPYPPVQAPVWDRLRRVWLPPADLVSLPEDPASQPERTKPAQP